MDNGDSDQALMLAAGKGDTLAYRQLVGRHIHRCIRFAERMLGNRAEAEDVTQEVMLKIWHEAPRWQPNAQLSTWLYRVIFNSCLNQRRKHIPLGNADLERIEDTSLPVDERIIQQQRSRQVKQALQQLPERQRAALILSYYEEASDQQAADALGVSLGALQQLLFRARQSLRHALHGQELEQKNGS